MSNRKPLIITTSPFVVAGATTENLMFKVIYALIPVLIVAVYFFGISALLLVTATTLSAMATEYFLAPTRTKASDPCAGHIGDGSALLTGLLLGLTLPPSLPLWMAFLGGFIAIALGKLIWGGLGTNMFNPALLGRAFLQAAFPEAMTTWIAPGQGFGHIPPTSLALPLMRNSVDVDAFSSATPLGLAKFEGVHTELFQLFTGYTGGSLGETSAILLILAGIWLVWQKVCNWRAPLATLLTVAILSTLGNLLFPNFPPPAFMLLSGGLLFGCVYMVTDPVTTPITNRGLWIFGIGLGFLVVIIRVWGGLPECVMFAILFMNALTPLINRYTQPRPFGG